jgi:methyl-accepting chemotaxis protein WspA
MARFDTLRSKFLLLIGVLTLGFAIFGGWSFYVLQELRVNGPVYDRIIQGKDLIADILPPPEYIIESYLVVLQLSEVHATGDEQYAPELVATLRRLKAEYDIRHEFWITEVLSTALREELLIHSYAPAVKFYDAAFNRLLPALEIGDKQEIAGILADLGALYQTHRLAIDEVVAMTHQRNADDEAAAYKKIEIAKWSLLAIFVTFVCVALGFTRVISSRLLRQLGGEPSFAAQIANEVKDGNLAQQIVLPADDTSSVLYALKSMLDRLSLLVGQVHKSVIQVGTSTLEINATFKEQQATASEIAATTSEVGATSMEISANSKELVRLMSDVSTVAAHSAALASNGQESLSRMEETMRHVMAAAGNINAKLGVLNEKAGKISQMVTTITDVADQTNLLSLNAAIEAENAGEHGRGFAVVATEIRRLADQTATATYDIEQMVKAIQSAVSAGIMGLEKFSEEVRSGLQDVQQVGGQLTQVIEQVQTLAPRFDRVSAGMQAQSTGAEQISQSLAELSASASQTVESLHQSGRVIDRLNQVAKDLRSGVSRFKLQS